MGSDKFEVVPVNIDTGDDEKPKTFLNETGVDALGSIGTIRSACSTR